MKWNVATKLFAGFGVCGALVIALAIVGAQSASQSIQESQRVVHTREVLGELSALFALINDAETGNRGFVITGQESYLDPYVAAVAQLEGQARLLSKLTSESQAQQRRFAELDPLLRNRLATLKRGVELRRTRGFEAVQAQILTGDGQREMSQIRRLVGEIDGEEAGALKAREASAARSARATFWALGMMAGLGLVFILLIGLAIHRNVAWPLTKLTQTAQRIAIGDLSSPMATDLRTDEVGALSRAFDRVTQTLRDQTRQLTEGANVLGASASEIVATSSQLAASAMETAAAVSETATTVQEVRQVTELSGQKARAVEGGAQRTAQISLGGKKSTEELAEGMARIRLQMEAIAASMVRLSEQGQAIGQIVAAVEDLAAQSNLLAVNAAIEAAKAGEHGKGFGVVAQEVRSLADQSRLATNQVRTLLGDIQKATAAAVMATEQGGKAVEAGERQLAAAGESLGALSLSVMEAVQAATQIAAAGREQLVGMDQVVSAMENIKQASGQNVASAKQLEAAARGLDELGDRVKKLVENYKL
jgi:methyl-accepting chemotaxis protein